MRNASSWLCLMLLPLLACSGEAADPPNPEPPGELARPAPAPDESARPVDGPSEVEPEPASPPIDNEQLGPETTGPGHSRSARELQVDPPGVSLVLPLAVAHGPLLQGSSLSRLSECDTYYMRVVNAALPRDALRVHAQAADDLCQTGMGSGLHVRVYVLSEPVEEAARAISHRAEAEIASFPMGRFQQMTLEQRTEDSGSTGRTSFPGWTYVFASYTSYHGDYSYVVVMDFFLRRFEEHTLVVVAMHHGGLVSYAGEERIDPIEQLITSVRAE